MGYPDLDSDESIILTTPDIKVKSVTFEAILTSKRLILVDTKKHLIQPQMVPLGSIRDVETGENAIRDPVVTLSLVTGTGSTRQMILTFSLKVRGERKRECEEWVKILKEQVAIYRRTHVSMPEPSGGSEQKTASDGFSPVTGVAGSTVPKKKIEFARPINRITYPVSPAPVPPAGPETAPAGASSLSPEGTFCSRCGNRVPPESTFCNRCGTKVVQMPPAPVTPARPVEQVRVHDPMTGPSPKYSLGSTGSKPEQKERPIEAVIHSIEPLIEDSVPRAREPAPLVTRQAPAPQPGEAEPAAAPAAESSESKDAITPLVIPESSGSSMEEIAKAALSAIRQQTASDDSGKPPAAPAPVAAEVPPVPPTPPSIPAAPAKSPKKKKIITIAAVLVILLVIAGVAFIFMNSGTGQPGLSGVTPSVTPTTTLTTTPTPTPASTPVKTETTVITVSPTEEPEILVPESGVWVHVAYPGTFTGSYGTPGNQQEVTATGDQFYQIWTVNGTVAVNFKKKDGSADLLLAEIYKNGELIKSSKTTVPKGVVEMQVDLKSE